MQDKYVRDQKVRRPLGPTNSGPLEKQRSVLFISGNLPSPRVPQAGHKVAYKNLQSYAGLYEIYLVSYVNEIENGYQRNKKDLAFCKRTYIYKLTKIHKAINIFRNPNLPFRAATRADKRAIRKIKYLLSSTRFDVVHFEFTSALLFIRYILPGTKTIVSEQDITYQACLRRYRIGKLFMKPLLYLEYKRFKKWELDSLKKVDEIWPHSEKDKKTLIEEGIPDNKIKVTKPFINMTFKNIKKDSQRAFTLLFWGAMNRHENVDAAEWLIEKIFPLVKKNVPGLKLLIVGANPPYGLLKWQCKDITVTGYVEDPAEYFEKATLAVLPLRLGAGIKYKVLECLEAGLSIITTDVGAEGISHDSIMIANNTDEFVKLITKHLLKKFP